MCFASRRIQAKFLRQVSITFDPFMYLTLPLPIQKKWSHTIRYIPWNPSEQAVCIPVEIDRNASFKDLRHLIGRWKGVDPDNVRSSNLFSGYPRS